MKKLDQFRGSLSPSQIASGMQAACDNALRLLGDAELMLEHGRYPSATALAILAIEEAGKAPILRGLALSRDEEELKASWRSYRSHTQKNVLWGLVDAVRGGARRLEDFSQLFTPGADHADILDQLKQISVYTDCLGNAHWSRPSQVIEEGLARQIVGIARLLCKERNITAREIELWVTHLGSAWNKHPERMEAALASWYASMQDAGLAESGANKMEGFIMHGLGPEQGRLDASGER